MPYKNSKLRLQLLSDFNLMKTVKYRCYFWITALVLGLSACGPAEQGAGHGAGMHSPIAGPDIELMALIEHDDAAYLTQLGLMRGHLLVGAELYLLGDYMGALTHMKHPESELYAELVPGLLRRSAPDFSDELESFAMAVEAGDTDAVVQQRYESLLITIAAAESAVSELSAELIVAVIVALLDNIEQEYLLAVDAQGSLLNLHEYQDASGFVSVASDYGRVLAAYTERLNVVQSLLTQLEFLQAVFPTISPLAAQQHAAPETVIETIAAAKRTLQFIE
jgi:hypothetical protein